MSRGRIIAGVVALVVIGGIVAGVMLSAQSGVPQVSVAKATKETLGVIVTASGKVEAATKGDVYAPTAGTLASVDVTDGAKVKAGQEIAVMDTAPLEAQVQQALAGLSGARAQLDAVNRGVPAAIDKSAANAGITVTKSQFDVAFKNWKAFHDAYESAPTTVQPSMEATLTQLRIAKEGAYATFLNAKSGRSKLDTASRIAAARASANAAVTSASYALSLAKSTLSDATLVAPMDGVVIFAALGTPGADGTMPKAAVGAPVTPASAVFTVVAFVDINFNAQVDEADVDKIKNGMKTKVSLDAFPSDTFDGTVQAIRTIAIQTTTGGIAFPVLVKVDPKDKNLLLGMSGSVDVEVNAVSEAITVPIEAILDESGKKFVFVIDAGKATKTEVTTGALTDTRAQIIKGVSEGQAVATNKLSELKDGAAVRTQ